MAQPREFRGNTYRELAELNAWTKQRREAAFEPDLPIIDPHHHFWDDEARGRCVADDLQEDIDTGHNIIATVYVETTSRYRAEGPAALRPVGEVEFVNGVSAESASARSGKARLCAGIVGHADLTLGDHVQPVLEALVAAGHGQLRGIRYGMGWDGDRAQAGRFKLKPQPPRYLAFDPTFRKGYARLQTLGLSFDASLLSQLPDLVDLLRALPNVDVVLNHLGAILGIPPHDKRDEVFAIWRGHIRDLAQFARL